MSLIVEDTRYINLNTQHGVSRVGTTDYLTSYLSNIDFHFRGLLKEEDDILYSHIDIANAQIPVSFYNINYACNTLKFIINNSSIQTLLVPNSNYNLTSLMIAIKTQFLSAGYSLDISFYKPTGKFTFKSSYDFTFLSIGSSILEILGFDSVQDYTSTNNILVGEHPCNLIGIKKLKFSSSALATNSLSSYGSDSLFGIIPVTAPPFGIIQYNNSSGRKSLLLNKVINSIDIQVTDENNRFVNFNNTEWSITLAITTTRKARNTGEDTLFSNMITPIIKLLKEPDKIQQEPDDTIQEPDISPLNNAQTIFTDENDLDFFLYKNGVYI